MLTHLTPIATLHQPMKESSESDLFQRLQKWNPNLDPEKFQIVQFTQMTWNNGALGCPIEGHYYTQALVPGYLILIQHEDQIIEVHTDSWLRSFAIPNVGFI